MTTTTATTRYGAAVARAWDRLHPRLTHRSAWIGHDGPLPVIEGTLIRLQVDHLPGDRDPKPVWLWSSATGAAPAERGPAWQAFLRRFDLEHTFRLYKQVLGWTTPKLRDPAAADRWTWLTITAHAQLRLARPSPQTCACPGNAPHRRGGSPPPASAAGLETSARRSLVQPVRPNPANPDPGARQDRRTAAPHPATTWGKPPQDNPASKHGANAQVKRQAYRSGPRLLRLPVPIPRPPITRYLEARTCITSWRRPAS